MHDCDLLIIGGGIVGLASAFQFTRRSPDKRVVVLEKEDDIAKHQTGRNSGVLHSGIYYKPGSLKATNCREGRDAMIAFCEEENVPFDICGKVIVAVEESELPALERIHQRGQDNGVACELIGPERLAEFEPEAAGVRAIHVPSAGIVDFIGVCRRLAARIEDRGGQIVTNAKATEVQLTSDGITVQTSAGDYTARYAINCAGLHCDRVAKLSGRALDAKIIPFRGEYFELKPDAQHLVKHLIYPVPDPNFPFLGVHFTRMIEGGVECGPNAVLAFAREGYHKTDINLRDLAESLTYPWLYQTRNAALSDGSRRDAPQHQQAGVCEGAEPIAPGD